MPIYVDRHDFSGLTAVDIAQAHLKDLQIQDRYGVRFLTYWFDEQRGNGFCLIDAPDIETAMRVHREAHGEVASDVIEVELSAVEAFLGRLADPPPPAPGRTAVPDSAFRAVMFTDIVNSTGMTARLGDERAVEMVRAHDSVVRRALQDAGGREVKHTGDGIMASFSTVKAAVACGRATQSGIGAFNRQNPEPLQLRIGIDAGVPVEDSNDLFGTTVQIAARICDLADPDAIVVSHTVRELLDEPTELEEIGAQSLKGIREPVTLYRIPGH